MTILKNTLFAFATTVALTSTSLAADEIQSYETWDVPAETSGFDWNGFYAGVGLSIDSAWIGTSLAGESGFVDLIAGFNYSNDTIVIGAEAWINKYQTITGPAANGYGIGAEVRGGFLPNEDVLVYASLGKYQYDAGARYSTIGAGIEFVAAENLTVDTELKHWIGDNVPFRSNSLGVSANWHFE